jgi:5-methylcytosine-specific restriction protein A
MPRRPPVFRPLSWSPLEARGCAASRGYDRRWRTLRAWFLSRHPVCVRCGSPASLVDHVTPLEDGGARLDPANLQALCRGCHGPKTRSDLKARKARRTGTVAT